MRSYTFKDGSKITYPEEITFAFNPAKITFTNTTGTIEMTVNGYTMKREPNNGMAYFDIASIIAMSFNRDDIHVVDYSAISQSKLSKTISAIIKIGAESFGFTTLAIWGGLYVGEVFNQSEKIRYFINYPMTIERYFSNSQKIQTKIYPSEVFIDSISVVPGYISIPLREIIPDGSVEKAEIRTFRNNTFDMTFDQTFKKEAIDEVTISVEIDQCSSGIYLRWINRHGGYSYYLFKEGAKTEEIKSGGEEIKDRYKGNNANYFYGQYIHQTKTRTRAINICAPLVSKYDFDTISDIVSSPIVDMFIGYKDGNKDYPQWLGINIDEKSITKELREMQDFEITLLLPDYDIQTL